jgi:hypothetical protein
VTTELSRRQRLTIGALLMALGAGVSLAIHFHPQQLWVALGPGARECGLSLGFISGAAPELLCRVGFGLSALLGLFILVLLIRQALKPWR